MNDLVLMGDGTSLPEHLQQYSDEAKKAAELVSSFNSLPKLSIRGKQFRIEKEGDEVVYPAGQPLDVVILASDPPAGTAKSYYTAAYAPGSDEMPDCFSSDGVTPDSFVEKPQARSCTECPHNVFGSGVDQKGNATKGKACGDHKNIFLVEASDVNSDILVLRVPPTSLKALSQYGRALAKHGVAPPVMITQLSFTDNEHPQLLFKGVRYTSEEEATITMARSKSDELALALPSLNQIEKLGEQAEPALPSPEVPALPAAPKEKVMTALAGGCTLEAFIAKGWTEEALIEHKYMELK